MLVNFSILTRICHSVNKGTFSLLLYNEGRGISFFFFFFLDSFVIFCSFSCSTEGTTWNLHPWLIDYTLECSGPPSWRCDPRQAYQNHSLGALEMNLRKETLFKSDSDDKKTRASAGPMAMTLASWRKLGWKIGSDIHKKNQWKEEPSQHPVFGMWYPQSHNDQLTFPSCPSLFKLNSLGKKRVWLI